MFFKAFAKDKSEEGIRRLEKEIEEDWTGVRKELYIGAGIVLLVCVVIVVLSI